MLDHLRKHLTLICAIITASILLVISFISLLVAEGALKKRNMLSTNNLVFSISQHLQSNHSISFAWLAQMETTNQTVISICSEEGAFLFPGAYNSQCDRQLLIQQAQEIALSTYHFDAFTHYVSPYEASYITFPLNLKGGHYYVMLSAVSAHDTQYELLLIKDLKQERQDILRLRLIFLIIDLVGLLLLVSFSLWFSGKAIRPIEESHKQQTDFIAAASHELRSPVAVIQAITEDLLSHDCLMASDMQGLHSVQHECKHLARLISDLLLLARLDAGKWSFSLEEVALDSLLIDIYDHFLSLVESHGRKLEIDLPDTSIPLLMLDPKRLEQVISILIDNALSYTPSGSLITLKLVTTKTSLELWVSDNGPGIPLEARKNIFKRFYRVDQARQSDTHCGLGLSIAYEIVTHLGGKLVLDPKAKLGCTFKLIFPFVAKKVC